ncbi:MAG: apolipoprotein N-acyltransferase [Spirulina sp. SIO3F2]|nr:apolipoprotein N-acyltransferase [Spirulina sp. SIO3F2]
MALATAPLSWFGLAWVAFAPLWSVCRHAPWRSRLLYGAAWGLGYYGGALFWITGIHPMTWMGVPWFSSLFIALVCWVLIIVWGTAIPMVWAILWPWLSPKTVWGRWLVGISLWCGLEALWQLGPLWWPSLAYTQSPNNLWILHWGQISGPTTVIALIVGVNGLLAEAILIPRRAAYQRWGLAIAAISFMGVAIWGGYSLSQVADSEGQPFRVGVIQGNVPNEIKLYPAGWRRAIAGYTQGYRALAAQGVDVVVTPETALPFVWSQLVESNHPFYRAIQTERVPVWVGAFGQEGTTQTNSLFSITATGQTLSQYDKVKLVPLGEYIPFAQLLGRFISRLSPLDATLQAGDPQQTFETTQEQAIAGICYESAFPEHFRRQAAQGGEFIVTVSNDAHYSHVMPAQHHALDVMRAIETDRWAIRATNTGYSAIVDPHGQTVWRSQMDTYSLHTATVERRHSQTLYVRWGDWLLWVLLFGSGISYGVWRLKGK